MTIAEELRAKKSRDNRDLLDRAADRIEELERKQSEGEWIKITPNNLLIGEYYCSCCNGVIDTADEKETPLDRGMYYCPNCGAHMRGGKDE